MTPTSVIENLASRGISLAVSNGSLRIDAPKGALSEADINIIQQNKQSIMLLLERAETGGLIKEYPPSNRTPLSMVQESMLLLDSISGRIPYSNNCYGFYIEGELNTDMLRNAAQILSRRHEILSSIYETNGDRREQVLLVNSPVRFSVEDLCSSNVVDEDLNHLLAREANHVFDLAKEPAVRICLIRLAGAEHYLSINFHQICCDGVSAVIYARQLSGIYSALIAAKPPEAGSEYQYRDYVAWQNRFKQTGLYRESLGYWTDHLQNVPELHALPTDFVRPSTQTFAGATLVQPMDRNMSNRLEKFAARHDTTPFVVMQATLACLVAKYSDETDLVIGTAAANRTLPEVEEMIGCFVNTLPFRYHLDMEWTTEALLAHVKDVIGQGLKHQHVSFDNIVNAINPRRSFSFNPLVQIMLVQQQDREDDLNLAGARVRRFLHRPPISRFDLTLHLYPAESGLELHWEYSTELFREASIRRLAGHFQSLLANLMADSRAPLSKLSFYKNDESPAPGESENTESVPPACRIHRLFEKACDGAPDGIALRHDSGSKTYAQLEAEANALAAWLRTQCADKMDQPRIGVCMDKSPLLVTCMLAVFKAGGVYVPLDPAYPEERLEFMLSDSKVDVLLTGPGFNSAHLSGIAARAEDAGRIVAEFAGASRVDPVNEDANSPAYVIYTSGSTGKPKGVLVPHKSLFYSLLSNSGAMEIGADDLLPTIGSQAFGVSLLEILLPLTRGGAVQLIPHRHVRDLDILINTTREVTVLHAVPSLMDKWLERVEEKNIDYPNLRLLLVGGEAVPDKLLQRIKKWRPDVKLLALYGMTESAVVCSCYPAEAGYSANYCIGKPYPTSCFFVLNEHLQPQPDGVPGQLYIGGNCLALGYLNQPDLTRQKFIDNPFISGEKIYQTGDRVRRLGDGNYEFLGRVDNQVSLRGVRIECGEIEALLAEHDGVSRAIAHVVVLEHGEPTLVAFIQAADANAESGLLQELREIIERNLPDYMRPAIFQLVSSFPLNPNGKVDRKSLPRPTVKTTETLPETETEIKLHQLWLESFEVNSVGIDTNYFEMGGNSLLATKIINKIKNRFLIDLSVSAMFEFPSIRQMAEAVDKKLREKRVSSLVYESDENELLENELLI